MSRGWHCPKTAFCATDTQEVLGSDISASVAPTGTCEAEGTIGFWKWHLCFWNHTLDPWGSYSTQVAGRRIAQVRACSAHTGPTSRGSEVQGGIP